MGRAVDESGRVEWDIRPKETADPNEVKAAAWNDGFTACAYEHMKQTEDPTHPITRRNPYKVKA